MRQFLVLGYHANLSSEAGEIIALSQSNSEAIALMNAPDKYRRKAIYEIAIPRQQRYFPETIEDFVQPDDDLEPAGSVDATTVVDDEPKTADAVEVKPKAKAKSRTPKK